jgi:hypothetical protein
MITRLRVVPRSDARGLRERYEAVALRFATGDLLRMLSQVAELDTEGRLRKSANPRIMLEALCCASRICLTHSIWKRSSVVAVPDPRAEVPAARQKPRARTQSAPKQSEQASPSPTSATPAAARPILQWQRGGICSNRARRYRRA